jgi:hypothetical protein
MPDAAWLVCVTRNAAGLFDAGHEACQSLRLDPQADRSQ